MKQFSSILMVLLVTIFLTAVSAMATPANLGELLGNPLFNSIVDNNATDVSATNINGDDASASAFILFEDGGWANQNKFGIYGYSFDSGTITVGDTLEIFQGWDSPASGSKMIYFDLINNSASLYSDGSNSISIGKTFGFYMTNGWGQTVYSQPTLNEDGIDHMMIFDTSSVAGDLNGATLVIGIEDMLGGGDFDYNDLTVGATGVSPAPEPATMLLFGTGLISLGAFGRRKFFKKG
jgi:hypothetical protein